MILTSCAVSPEHLTARRLIALITRASNPSLTFCMLGNFSCFYWRLLAFFFKINFLQSVLIWVKAACIGYQQKTVSVASSKERVKRTCTTIHWTTVYASSKGSDEPAHLRSIATAFAARTERMKRCRRRFRPNSVPSKALVLLLLIIL